jgi:hypothetical protein
MGKEELEATIAAFEISGRTIDNWILIFAVGVALCLSAEVVFSVAHWGNEQKLRPLRALQSQLHENELAKLAAETARLSTEGDVARKETAEAKLQLEQLKKQVGPRNLNWNASVDAMKGAPRVRLEILYVADDNDSMHLAQQIQLACSAAGWELPSRNPIQRPPGWSEPLAMAVDGQPTGVTIVSRSPTPADSIEAAISAGIGRVGAHHNGPYAPPVGTARIVVAPRP